jgi:CheY-like chemotaxis protein
VTDAGSNTQSQPKRADTKNCLTLWDSSEILRIRRVTELTVKPLRILLAEDNPLDQISIRRLLEKLGLEVTLAGDGRAAVEKYGDGAFDLVLLDILMPEMDGFEVAVHIREHEKASGSHIPIIALTAYSLMAVFDKCKSVGMSGYLPKPVANSDLRALFSVLMPEFAERLQ